MHDGGEKMANSMHENLAAKALSKICMFACMQSKDCMFPHGKNHACFYACRGLFLDIA